MMLETEASTTFGNFFALWRCNECGEYAMELYTSFFLSSSMIGTACGCQISVQDESYPSINPTTCAIPHPHRLSPVEFGVGTGHFCSAQLVSNDLWASPDYPTQTSTADSRGALSYVLCTDRVALYSLFTQVPSLLAAHLASLHCPAWIPRQVCICFIGRYRC